MFRRRRQRLADAIDMAGDEVAAQFVADAQRAFQVDPGARRASVPSVVCASVSAEASTANQSGADLDRGQAAAGAGDRGAERRSPRCPARARRSPAACRRRRRAASMSRTVPSAVTMPVNIQALPGEFGQHVVAQRRRAMRGRSAAWRRGARCRRPAPPASRRRPSPRAHGTRRCGPPDRRAAATRRAARRPPPARG